MQEIPTFDNKMDVETEVCLIFTHEMEMRRATTGRKVLYVGTWCKCTIQRCEAALRRVMLKIMVVDDALRARINGADRYEWNISSDRMSSTFLTRGIGVRAFRDDHDDKWCLATGMDWDGVAKSQMDLLFLALRKFHF